MSAFHRLASRWPGPAAPLRVLAASGQLGFGIPDEAFRRGAARAPHVIAADMGSVDPGPSYLGSGTMAAPEALARRDLALVLSEARRLDVPLLIGSAGTAGASPHLDAVLTMVRDIAGELGLAFRLGVIRSDIPKPMVLDALGTGRLHGIGGMATDAEAVKATPHIVGQAGLSSFIKALEDGADVIVGGRACDTAPFAAVPVALGYPRGPALHMAKIIECTSLCCEPGGRDAMLGTIEGESFTLESMNPARRATPVSVAAHALYEQADPFEFREPEGAVRLDEARYEALDAARVRVSGARWLPNPRPDVKIEGARRLGARAVLLASAMDPAFIRNYSQVMADVEAIVRGMVPGDWSIYPRDYAGSAEIFLLAECVAPDAALARTVLAAVRQQLLHFGFPGRKATGGNLAFPITPPELDAGDAYAFSVYHILDLPDREALDALFPVGVETIGGPR